MSNNFKLNLGALVMINYFLKGSVIGLFLLTAACQTLTNPLELGQSVSNGYQPGSLPTQIALPKGNWEVAEYTTSSNNNVTFMIKVTLIERKGNQVSRAVSFIVPRDAASGGYVVSKYCSRDNMHFRETETSAAGGMQDCFWVNHYRPTFIGSKNERMRKIGEYLNKNNIEVPNHLIQVGYRFADSLSLLNVTYYFNPDVDGFSKNPRTSWNTSPWHPSNTASVPSRQEYVDKLIKWAKSYKPTVVNAFKGLAPKEITKSSDQKTTDNPASTETQSSSTIQRLQELKNLLEKGLISKSDFDLKKAEILRGL